MKPYAASCDDNKDVILSLISPYLSHSKSVLEIASGTGQHAIYFAKALSHLTWQPSDLDINLKGITEWLDDAQLSNVLAPIALDVSLPWPIKHYDAVFSANALHIMSQTQVEDCFKGLGNVLKENSICLFYGPFNYKGEYSSDSNKRFDAWLKNNDPKSAIKDFEAICGLAKQQGLNLQNDHAMPANNRLLAFMKH